MESADPLHDIALFLKRLQWTALALGALWLLWLLAPVLTPFVVAAVLAYALHPAFAEARIMETGTGIRPAFPDNMPRLIETSDGLAVAGMHRHGFLLAPALAREAADRLTITNAIERRRSA